MSRSSARASPSDEARRIFADQPYKLELIDELARARTSALYRHGTFLDLCRGPPRGATHGQIGAFKLLNVAGAYWRGDEKRPMLQRIYGTAWPTQAELDDYLQRLEEARAARPPPARQRAGPVLLLTTTSAPACRSSSPKGEMLRYLMESYVRETQTRYGYQHVWTGHLVKESLFRQVRPPRELQRCHVPADGGRRSRLRLKPMNCPSHMTLFNEMGVHSYRELPLRFAEFATLYRYEKSGDAQRPDARALADAGRLPHLLHAGADRGGVRPLPAT